MDCKIGDQEKQKILLQIKLMDNLEKDYTYWKCVLWSDETKLVGHIVSCTLPTGKLSGGRIILCRCFSGISNCEFHQSGRNHEKRKIYQFFERNPQTVSSITKQKLLLVKNSHLKTEVTVTDWL